MILLALLALVLCVGGFLVLRLLPSATNPVVADDSTNPEVLAQLSIFPSDPAHFVTDTQTYTQFVDNELLVIAREGVSQDTVTQYALSFGGKVVGYNRYLRQYQIQLSAACTTLAEMETTKEAFLSSGLFDDAYPNYVMTRQPLVYEHPNDKQWKNLWDNTYTKRNWGAKAIDAPGMWAIMESKALYPVNVGVLDGQFYTAHEDLEFAGTYMNEFSHNNHGTHVAGIIAATYNNGKGIAGISHGATLYGASMKGAENRQIQTNEAGTVTVSAYEACLTYLICIKECKVINISYGTRLDCCADSYRKATGLEPDFSPGSVFYTWLDNQLVAEAKNSGQLERTLKELLRIARSEGRDFLIVKAAGNDNEWPGLISDPFYDDFSSITDPELKDRIIVVGNAAYDENGEKESKVIVESSSEYGSRVDIIAPGTDIYSTVYYEDDFDNSIKFNRSTYAYDTGTSMAAPQVSGVAAAIWRVNPNLSGPAVKDILIRSATGKYYYQDRGKYPDHYPMLNASAAMAMSLNYTESAQANFGSSSWSSAYQQYIASINPYDSESIDWEHWVPSGSPIYYQSSYSEDYQPYFALYDFNKDGTPELIACNGANSFAMRCFYVFTVNREGLTHIGDLYSREGGFFSVPSSNCNGVFVLDTQGGEDWLMYFTLENGAIRDELVTINDLRNTWDANIYQAALTSREQRDYLDFYTREQIQAMGWNAFTNTN